MRAETPQSKLGRNGELLASAMYAEIGFTQLDLAAASARGAPLVKTWEASFVAPDAIMFRRAILFNEIKTKARAGKSDGGPRDTQWVPGGQRFHCIERQNYLAYKHAGSKASLPVIITVISIDAATIFAASIRQLGEPYQSLQPELMDVVNFPERRFTALWEFDPKRLPKFFEQPTETLTPKRMKLFVEWLRPRQGELDFFRAMILDECERQWITIH